MPNDHRRPLSCVPKLRLLPWWTAFLSCYVIEAVPMQKILRMRLINAAFFLRTLKNTTAASFGPCLTI